MLRFLGAGLAVGLWLSAGVAAAADLSGLNWGEFRLAGDSAAKPSGLDTGTDDNVLSLSMTLEKLIANADGAKTEDSASMEGEFVVEQPRRLALHSMRIELSGLIVKTAGATAELAVNIGGIEKKLEWKADEVASRRFNEVMTVAVPNGQLPAPFPVSAVATVAKPAGGGAVLLSLETIKVTVGQARVAELLQPPTARH